ncbi:MAG TPA: redoxin domain-containing protein [Acidimicrobiia bacterium]|nr:redoxin domain-containing protein [Acidimicrobiia bacterium]
MAQLGSLTPRLRKLGAESVGIAVTATFSQMAFAEALGIDFPLLSDWDGETAHAYGVQYDTWKGHRGLAKRSLFVVDTERVIRHVWVSDDALVVPDFEDAVTVIEDLTR